MSAIPTPLLRLFKQAVTSNPGFWGSVWNESVASLLDASIAGEIEIDMNSGSFTLTPQSGVTDNSRVAIIKVTNAVSSASSLIVPATNKLYVIVNQSLGDVKVKTAFDSGVTVIAGLSTSLLFVDGTNLAVRTVGFADLLAYPSVSQESATITIPNTLPITTVNVIVYRENGLVKLSIPGFTGVWTATDLVIPVLSAFTGITPAYQVSAYGWMLDSAVPAAFNAVLDSTASGGSNLTFTRSDGTPWSVANRQLAGGLTMTYTTLG
jgi:hypothetical protein